LTVDSITSYTYMQCRFDNSLRAYTAKASISTMLRFSSYRGATLMGEQAKNGRFL